MGGPNQSSTETGTVTGQGTSFYVLPVPRPATAVAGIVFHNGLLCTTPFDALMTGNFITLGVVLESYGSVTVETWTPDYLPEYAGNIALPGHSLPGQSFPGFGPSTLRLNPDTEPPNLPVQYTSADGSLAGAIDGVNTIYAVATTGLITQVLLWLNGKVLVEGVDYTWAGNLITVALAAYRRMTGSGGAHTPGSGLPGSTLPGFNPLSAAPVLTALVYRS